MGSRRTSWKKHVMQDTYLEFYDGLHATPKPAEKGPVFLGIKNITEDGRLDLTEVRHIAEEDFDKWTRRVSLRPGDIVFSYEATLNLYAIIPEGFRGCLGRRLALLRPNLQVVDTRFLFYYFFGAEWRGTIAKNLVFGSTVDRVPLIRFPNFEISLPPLPIQRKIAGILSAYDDLIENNTRRIKLLEKIARTIYREWFVEFRAPNVKLRKATPEERKLTSKGLLPIAWSVQRLADFGNIVTGKTPSKAVSTHYGTYMPFIKTPSMHGKMFCIEVDEYLSALGAASQGTKTLPPNSLIVNCIGALAGSVSITSAHSQTNQQINAIVLNDLSTREFLYFSLTDLKETIRQHGATGATMLNLSKSKFESLQVVRPDQTTMTAFHDLVFPSFELISLPDTFCE